MATIDVKRAHDLGLEVARERAEQLAKDLEKKMGIVWRWEGYNIKFDAKSGMAKGVSGAVSVTSSSVRVEIDLPFLMRAMKGTIAGQVDRKLDKLTAPVT